VVDTARAVDLTADLDVQEQAETTAKAGPIYTFGLGIAFAPDYEGSEDYAAVPLWNLRAGNLYHPDTFVQVVGPVLRSNLLPDDHWRLGISGRYQPDYDNVDNSRVQDIKDTEAAGLLGITVGYDFVAGRGQDVALELDAQYDVANGNGGILTPRLRWQSTFSQQLVFGAAIWTTWGSEDYMGNRFSINSGGAARSGLDEYDADSGFKNAALAGTAGYRFTENWSLTGIVGYSRLFSEAADSPIVDDEGDENQFLGGLLVSYSF
jgi:outer membrane scaffolding protein for murein synthesis (MipA/OmpV family)